jgi:peptide-methionine (S)-S-oxide reductase
VASPSYESVCQGTTGHAEVVQVTFDPEQLSYIRLLEIFFATHDPTTRDRQGNDLGSQYRSVIFTHSEEQMDAARATIASLDNEGIFSAPIVTEVAQMTSFWPAEEYHQNYFSRHPQQPYCRAVVGPKVAKFRQRFADLLR